MLRNIIYISGSIVLFFTGVLLYGILLNMNVITLEESLQNKTLKIVSDPEIIIDRKNYVLQLYSDTVLVKSYKAVFGRGTKSVKTDMNDYNTPAGKYKICRIDTGTVYHKNFLLNYPNQSDAAEALKTGYIGKKEYYDIIDAQNKGICPPVNTTLGANISIHGIGEYDFIFRNLPFIFNWTNGSIAVSNSSIDELLKVVKVGTEVTIKN